VEFGMPQWVFGMSTYAFESARRIICTYIEQGVSRLARLDTIAHTLELIASPYSRFDSIQESNGRIVFGAGSPIEPTSIVSLDLATRHREVLRRSSEVAIDSGYLSQPRAIEFPT